MQQKKINISRSSQLEIFGDKNQNLDLLKIYYPKLKLILRDEELKVIGDDKNIKIFLESWSTIENHHSKFGSLSVIVLKSILENKYHLEITKFVKDNVLLYGNKGRIIRSRSLNQFNMVNSIDNDDLLFAVGPAGSGKTYTAVALAVKALKEKRVRKIILTRPAVEAGENLGFLPGDLKEKLDPYMQPLYDALRDMIPHERLESYLEKGVIQIAPLAFMRGRTLDNAFVILDEAQNTTHNQMKMFLTRMGKSAKFIITGDPGQIDLPRKQVSGLKESLLVLKDINGIAQVYLDDKDVVRHKLVKSILSAYKTIEKE